MLLGCPHCQLEAWLPTKSDSYDVYAVALQECPQGKAWQRAMEEHVGAESLSGLGFAKPIATGNSAAETGTGAGAGAGAGASVEFNDDVANINDLDDDDFDGEEFVQGRGQRFRRQAESILSLNTARLSLADADAANHGHTEATGGFRTVASVSLWNIHLVIMVRTELAPRITEVRPTRGGFSAEQQPCTPPPLPPTDRVLVRVTDAGSHRDACDRNRGGDGQQGRVRCLPVLRRLHIGRVRKLPHGGAARAGQTAQRRLPSHLPRVELGRRPQLWAARPVRPCVLAGRPELPH